MKNFFTQKIKDYKGDLVKKEKKALKGKKEKQSNPLAAFFWTNKRRRAKNIYFILTVCIVIVAAGVGYVSNMLDSIDYDDNGSGSAITVPKDDVIEDEEFQIMKAINSAGSLNEYLYEWANNGGELRSSKNVINVLLVGLDSDTGLESGGRSDSLILVSLNKKTKKINMTSFFRDTWTYMDIGGYGRYGKMNSSYYFGSDEALLDTLEKDFKIDIDYYVAVDFSSFTDIINALGGLTIEVEQYEAEYINRTTVHTIDYGPSVKLDGYEALVYARIRHSDSDSDVSRTRRQRKVISALINSAKGASLSQLSSALDALFKYVKTDLTKMQILSYAAQALTNGWINYEIVQTPLSDEDIFRTGWVGDESVVLVDFPLAAQRLQEAIYGVGESNIVLDENRVIPFSLVSGF